MNRRAFLTDGLFTGGLAITAGCIPFPPSGYVPRKGKSMAGFRAPPMDKVRIGVIGLGLRGSAAVARLCRLPDTAVTALCDIREDRVSRQAQAIAEAGQPLPKTFFGDAHVWEKMCESPDVDLIYICTPWLCHTPMAVCAMRCGKHAATEIPAALTVEQCWELVDTSETTRRHCIMLENSCYAEDALLALALCRKGRLGTLVHGEASFIRDLRESKLTAEETGGHQGKWCLAWSQQHAGNPYPTHGLGPVCQCMGINRGDRMLSLTSTDSGVFGLPREAARLFGENSPEAAVPYRQGDMNITAIRTYRGRTILLRHDASSPRPSTCPILISGTKGILMSDPLRIALEPNAHQWIPPERLRELKAEYAHPLWRKHGAHGGMDYLMDYRLCHCLKNSLPLDMDVYDAASWSCLVELTERSVLKGGAPVDVPDFTRGGWKTAEPLAIVEG